MGRDVKVGATYSALFVREPGVVTEMPLLQAGSSIIGISKNKPRYFFILGAPKVVS
jgi:hypothetical protein